MLQASGCLSADDVAIRCRVRHSPYATNREFNEAEEMICTMRIWHQSSSRGSSLSRPASVKKTRSVGSRAFDSLASRGEQHGPELILNPVALHMHGIHACCSGELRNPIQLSQRFASFGSGDGKRRSPHPQRDGGKRIGAATIPVADIMVVDMYGQGGSHRTNITTMSNGFFEFTLENRNGQDVLLAFLKASLPKERVMEGSLQRSPSGFSLNTECSSRSVDVEAFTASRIAETNQHESFSEKLRRKVGRVVSSIEEISTAITECACGCSRNTAVSPAPLHSEKRDSPPRNLQYEYDTPAFEIAPDSTPVGKRSQFDLYGSDASGKRREMMKNGYLPSGLSVECDPEFESTAY